MNEFDTMISGWKNQPVPKAGKNAKAIVEKAKKRIGDSRKKHVITIIVLGVTLAILILFTFYVGLKSSLFLIGIGLMISALAVRIGVEAWSSTQLKKLDISGDSETYLKQLIRFYQLRKRIHGTFTVVVFGLYVLGFLLLLPLFKASLSQGFFIYILVSGVVVLASLIFFIRKKVKEELHNLNQTVDELSAIAQSFNE